MAWFNNDGLYIKFGVEEAASHSGGEVNVEGLVRVATIAVDLTKLTTALSIPNDVFTLDKGVRVEKTQLDVITGATTSSSATFNVGLLSTDRSTGFGGTTPNLGLASGVTTAAMAAQGTLIDLTVGATGAGTQLGTTLGKNALITCSTGAGTFTAGFVMVRIHFTVPNV